MGARLSKKSPKTPLAVSQPRSARRVHLIAFAILSAYAAALVYQRESVPAGMNNDVAEEALRGLYLVEGNHFEVLTFSVGNSAETLYLYLVGLAAHVVGPTMLSVQLVSWLFALACIWLIWKVVERIDGTIPPWIPLLTAACSLWLFHYARNGLRAIAAPVFLAAFALLLARSEDGDDRGKTALACGAVLGLGIYGYTSARALPLAFLAYAAVRLLRNRDLRPQLLRRYGLILAGAFLTSIPNVWFLVRYPKEFLSRGDYVMAGNAADYVVQVIWSALMPVFYSDHYRHIQIDRYRSDGVAAGLTSTGQNPLPYLFAIAFLIGLWQLRRFMARPAALFLLCAWIVTTLSVGIAGPSPTRLLVLLPVYLAFAALGFAWIVGKWPAARIPAMVLILAAGAFDSYRYFTGSGQGPDYRLCYDPSPLAIGERAEALAAQGQRVMSIVSRDYNVVHYLTYRHAANVNIAEFFVRPFDPAVLPLNEFRPDVLLMQPSGKFRSLLARMRPEWRVGNDDRYFEFHLPH